MRIAITMVMAILLIQSPATAQERTKEGCAESWLKGEQMGLIKGIRSNERSPTVVVDEGFYADIDYDIKVAIAETFNCMLLDPGEQFPEIIFRSAQTNKELAIWNFGKLTVR